MKYILLANNSNFNTNIRIEENDTLVLFNYLIPFKEKIIPKHENKIWVLRINQSVFYNKNISKIYAGSELLFKYEKLFKKICFYNSPKYLPENIQKISIKEIDMINKPEKIIEIDKYVENLKKEIAYPKYKNMSTGLIYYNYLQKKEPGCKILLAGFTSEVNKNYHHASWERNYFKKELNSGRCEMLW